ncbi:XrtA/PEP-CTERM system histidine kinase PrsK [uncultured Erythrobacter sp.]|uniref:XrtA/PEP-CTERM system histidine kinase PrsK n=1 Tax=uncultured Erythrobacter sp. TaxID=263913 RepID=UPI0026230BC5|nr:XrtA/PEP-CTERM system histidine kinase PrsK [uncultured Erythrobacter sp.]
MFDLSAFEPLLATVLYLAGAVLSAGAGLWIARFGDRERPDRSAALWVCTTSAIWCAASVALDQRDPAIDLAATARNLALIAVIFRLFAADGRDESVKPIRPVIIALVLVQMFQPVLLFVRAQTSALSRLEIVVFEVGTVLNMLVAIGALVLLHNLYAGATATSRKVIRWSALGLAALFAYELNFYTIAYMSDEYPASLLAVRGAIAGVAATLLAIGASSTSSSLQLRPSRAVTFQTLSLLVIGTYLLVMVLVSRSLALLGGDFVRIGQVAFLLVAIVVAFVWLPSERLRGWLRVTATKHLFQHRYDYREEWLRFTRTIGRASSGGASIHTRAVKAIADITDSPAGMLLMPNEEAQLELTARWNWSTIEVPAEAAQYKLAALLEQHSHILDLDEVRAGVDHHGELAHVPSWLIEAEDAWALAPLIHFDRLVGVIVLARPRIERQLDWEDFDLLRVAGQQLASYLAEQAGQQALMDASRFDEFNRRMAFVMHDIKNLASQLSLLSGNAAKHADNPDFRADMLVTLRNSSEKLNALLARLGRYGSGQTQDVREIDLTDLAERVTERFRANHPVSLSSSEPVMVLADAEALEQAVIHLVQNAVDASTGDEQVFLSVRNEGLNGHLDVIDSGIGMSPEFVRSGLYKPFVSSKDGGFGIGAFEAREMIRAMGGRISVESREGVGTRFGVSLPVPEAARLLAQHQQPNTKEVA